ncbi:MAG TPA: FHA domain-containing protein [Anaerolineales bacterium]|nr:FHA domain-containing protein [Anaerolineales bacterium]HUS83719.1 FHA domain-containing protein [Anaerolineales bacterium]
MPSSDFRMIVRTGPNPGTVFELTKEVSLIGRDVTNDVVVGDAEVSRQHARLTRTPGGHVLEDLGSTNGTFVNSERLVAPRVLNPGDLIALGETITVTFDATSPEAAATVAQPAVTAEPAKKAPREVVRPAGQAQPAAPPSPAVDGPAPAKKGKRPWLLAGVGCFVLILVCGGFIWFMDSYYPQILYAPLIWLGF